MSRPRPSGQPRPPPPGAARFPALAGVGCAPSTGTSAVTGSRNPGGDGWVSVHGGLPACGGHTLATRKTGTMGFVQDTFTWTFRTAHPATCTAQIFVANTNPSSGFAHYDVYGDSLAAAASIGQFTINQGSMKGQWVQEGTWNVRDILAHTAHRRAGLSRRHLSRDRLSGSRELLVTSVSGSQRHAF